MTTEQSGKLPAPSGVPVAVPGQTAGPLVVALLNHVVLVERSQGALDLMSRPDHVRAVPLGLLGLAVLGGALATAVHNVSSPAWLLCVPAALGGLGLLLFARRYVQPGGVLRLHLTPGGLMLDGGRTVVPRAALAHLAWRRHQSGDSLWVPDAAGDMHLVCSGLYPALATEVVRVLWSHGQGAAAGGEQT